MNIHRYVAIHTRWHTADNFLFGEVCCMCKIHCYESSKVYETLCPLCVYSQRSAGNFRTGGFTIVFIVRLSHCSAE